MNYLPDIINGLYEAFGCIAVLISCRRLMKDKKVAGISIITIGFFTSWGLWNLFYYPHLGQLMSGVAAGAVCAANLFWCFLLFKYRTPKVTPNAIVYGDVDLPDDAFEPKNTKVRIVALVPQLKKDALLAAIDEMNAEQDRGAK